MLVTNADWYPEAMQCMSEIISIVETVGKRYVDSGDLASAAALYEGTCYALERLLDPMDSSLQRVSRKAENLFSALEDNEKEQVAFLTPSGLLVPMAVLNSEYDLADISVRVAPNIVYCSYVRDCYEDKG